MAVRTTKSLVAMLGAALLAASALLHSVHPSLFSTLTATAVTKNGDGVYEMATTTFRDRSSIEVEPQRGRRLEKSTRAEERRRRRLQSGSPVDIILYVINDFVTELYDDFMEQVNSVLSFFLETFEEAFESLTAATETALMGYTLWQAEEEPVLYMDCAPPATNRSDSVTATVVLPSLRWVRVNVTEAKGDVCTLVYHDLVPNSEDDYVLIPLGRSYDGHDWEPVGTRFDMTFDCADVDGRRSCLFRTPYISPLSGEAMIPSNETTTEDNPIVGVVSTFGSLPFGLGDLVVSAPILMVETINNLLNVTRTSRMFQLRAFNETSTRSVELKSQDLAARFFEQATFGPTRELLAPYADKSVDEVNDGLAQWTHDQLSEPSYTSHRQTFRRQINTRLRYTKTPGMPQHPCDPYTMWHTYTFRIRDSSLSPKIPDQYVGIFNTTNADGEINNETVTLFMYNMSRTEVANVSIIMEEGGNATVLSGGYYKICEGMGESIGGMFELEMEDEECYPVVGGNPKISFSTGPDDNPIYPAEVFRPTTVTAADLKAVPIKGKANTYWLENGLAGEDFCDSTFRNAYPVYMTFDNVTYYAFDPRLVLQNNTMESPQADGGGYQKLQGASCNNVARTFLNEDTCVLSDANIAETCSSTLSSPNAEILLTEDNLGTFHELAERYVYTMADIAVSPDDNPCTMERTSRWQRVTDSTVADDSVDIDDYTRLTLTTLLNDTTTATTVYSDHFNALRDIYYNDVSLPCYQSNIVPTPDANKRSRILVELEHLGEVWELVHPDLGEVFDMTPWIDAHFGEDAFVMSYIENGDSHLLNIEDMAQQLLWKNNRFFFPHLGTYNTTTTFADLPNSLQQDKIAEHFDVIGTPSGDDGTPRQTMLCGSPNEIANDLSLGNTGFSIAIDDYDDLNYGYHMSLQNDLWPGIVLSAPDQLRQRISWALAQLFAISPDAVAENEQTEGWMYYYDIFVRNAFGTYPALLKEISYSPHMSEMLTFIGSRSAAYVWENYNVLVYADENYAREIMQLFSIGVSEMNMDGTLKLDDDGNEILTYTNDHIQSFARAWTGFARQTGRGNAELAIGNRIDPMYIVADWRDVFPKVDLYKGFIGDITPLCKDLPEAQFLKKGAKYRLLGSTTRMELHRNPVSSVDLSQKMMTLEPGSSLYDKLCQPDGNGDCDYPSMVTLNEDFSCFNEECNVDTVRVIEVGEGIHFEYIRPTCVELAFLEEAYTVRSGYGSSNAVCADPSLAVAGDACCNHPTANYALDRNCAFIGERMKRDTAISRCRALGKRHCVFNYLSCGDNTCCAYRNYHHWSSDECTSQVKVEKMTGNVAMVHRPKGSTGVDGDVKKSFREDNLNFFEVYWDGDTSDAGGATNNTVYPNDSNLCGNRACTDLDDSCLCNLVVKNEPVFLNSDVVSTADIKQSLFIGSPSPESFGKGVFMAPVTRGNVRVHQKIANDNGDYGMDTIFEVTENSKTVYYKNQKSYVVLVDDDGQEMEFKFRNPPHFNSFVESEARDAHYETEAVLASYMKHPNVPPFISKFFMLRFGVSNPAPRYVETVATAFKDGTYVHTKSTGESLTFGSGEFGDLSAMVAAILLDRDSRSVTLDLDQSSGSLKEPLLKVLHLLRAMGYNPYPELSSKNTMFSGMNSKIDQMAHAIKTVFSFFRSDYALPGPIQQSWLVAPESLRYMPPYVIGLLNGLFSIVKYGLTNCDQGFGVSGPGSCRNGEGNVGNLTYTPANPDDAVGTVDELATILTAGRLSQESREMILNEYGNAETDDQAFKVASHLVVSSPEFHSAGGVKEFSGEKRVIPPWPEPSDLREDYKAVLFLNFQGGMDSFNMIVPHSGCKEKDMYEEYKSIRGNIALDKSTLLTIDAGGEPQVCDYFGVHADLPALKTLYNNGDLLFICNQGVLFEDVNKYDWYWKTPYPVFGHSSGQREIQRVDPKRIVRETGVFGRMNDAMTKLGHKTGAISVASSNYMLVGEPNGSPFPMFIDRSGVKKVFPGPPVKNLQELVEDMNNVTTITSGKFAAAWSENLSESIWQNELLHSALENATIFNEFPDTSLGQQFKWVSKAISGRDDLGLDRCAFYLKMGGFDTHFDQVETLGPRFQEINEAVEMFVDEMRKQNMWEKVVLVTGSDFGRTITPNGGEGTDHGWGGNYFAVGGSLRGGRIVGEYPSDLTRKSDYMVGRSRPIPTTSYDAVLQGVAQWYGVTDPDALDRVLPQRHNFNRMFTAEDLFA